VKRKKKITIGHWIQSWF